MATIPSNRPAEATPASVASSDRTVDSGQHEANGTGTSNGGGPLPARAVPATAVGRPPTVRPPAAPGSSRMLPFTAEQESPPESSAPGWLRIAPSWLASMLFHLVVLLIMAVWFEEIHQSREVQLSATTGERVELEDLTSNEIQPIDVTTVDTNDTSELTEDIVFAPSDSIAETVSDDLAANTSIEVNLEGGDLASSSLLTQTISRGLGESLSGIRAGPNKAEALRKGGGNEASEAAVAAALKWLASQQLSDGGWTFDLRKTPNPCKDPGQPSVEKARNAATALALLPFLGAGHTQKEGRYSQVVRRGLYFLSQRARPGNTRFGPGASFVDPERGVMYSHGMASIAVCEAYAMTGDKALHSYAQAAANFIAAAQCADGGWRYQPNDPTGGDTSVVGWQMMALKSASMGYQIGVPKQTLARAYAYLDQVQTDEGSGYRYMINKAQESPATTAIGLLCRMYFGWKKDNPALVRGVERLAKRGPSTGEGADMYFNYYATQVMRHWEGDEWKQWNEVMRDFLIESQATKGRETGSWHFNDSHGDVAGRLYSTALATMTLEVYYRHLPIYQKASTEAEFKP